MITNEEILEVSQYIRESVPDLSTIDDKKLILFLGDTGAGKSTLIYYLMEGKLKTKGGRRDLEIVPVEENDNSYYPQITSGTQSGTSVPKAYPTKNKDFYYCDVPGFNDNRGKLQRICNTLTLQSAVERAKAIHGVVVTIDFNSLKVGKDLMLGPIIQSFNNVLQATDDLDSISDQLIFAITRSDPEGEDDLSKIKATAKKKFQDQIKRYQEQIEELENKIKSCSGINFYPKAKKIFQTIKAPQENPDESESWKTQFTEAMRQVDSRSRDTINVCNLALKSFFQKKKLCELIVKAIEYDKIIIVDVMDNGETRSRLSRSFGNSTLDKKYLRFDKNDEDRITFDNILFAMAGNANQKFAEYFAYQERLKRESDQLLEIKKKRMSLMDSLEVIKKDVLGLSNHSTLRDNINDCHRKIQQRAQLAADKERILQQLRTELLELESQEKSQTPYPWPNSLDESRTFFTFLNLGFLGNGWWSNKTFKFPQADPRNPIPILDLKVERKPAYTSHEQYSVKQEDWAQGVYISQYSTNFFCSGYIKIDAYVAKRHMPNNQIRAQNIRQTEIPLAETALAELRKEIVKFEAEKLNDENDLTRGVEVSELLQTLPKKIADLAQGISEQEQKLSDAASNLSKVEKDIIAQLHLFKSIKMLISSLGYNFVQENVVNPSNEHSLLTKFYHDFTRIFCELEKATSPTTPNVQIAKEGSTLALWNNTTAPQKQNNVANQLPEGLALGVACTDGDCLFDSVAQLMNDGSNKTGLRQKAVDYMRGHPNEFIPFFEGSVAGLNARTQSMENSLVHGDDYEVAALSLALGRQIIVISNGTAIPAIGRDDDPILFLHHQALIIGQKQIGHYRPISLRSDANIDRILQTLYSSPGARM